MFQVPKPYQRWGPVIHLSRLNSFLVVKKTSIKLSLITREWVSSIALLDAHLHIPIHPYWFLESSVQPQVSNLPVHLSSFRPSHGPTNLYNDSKGSEAYGFHQRDQTSTIPGRLAYQGRLSGRVATEHRSW